jgi:beta-lactamase regulating signal transducer with metallopeptidase domain
MLEEIVYYVLNMSILSTFVMLVVFLLRRIGKKWFTKNMIVFLWLFVLVRLLVPFALSSEYSVIGIFDEQFVKTVPIDLPSHSDDTTLLPHLAFSNTIQQAEDYNPMTYKSSTFEDVLQIISWVWLVGVLTVALVIGILTKRFRNSIDMSYSESWEKYKIFTSKQLTTPIVLGVIRPRIILPEIMNDEVKEFAILHEVAHIKRKDNLWKQVVTFATVIHWFNPFCWMMLNQLSKDIEQACDEKVVRSLAKHSVKDYAMALVIANEELNNYVTAFSGNQLEQRIYAIVEFRKLSKIMIGLTIVIYIVLSIVLMTNGLE